MGPPEELPVPIPGLPPNKPCEGDRWELCGAVPATRFSRKDAAKLQGLIRSASPVCCCSLSSWLTFPAGAPGGAASSGSWGFRVGLRLNPAAVPNRCYTRASEDAHGKRVPLPLLQLRLTQCQRTRGQPQPGHRV